MRILHAIPFFAPAWAYGGTPRAAFELCRALVERGHEVTVYTSDTLDAHSRIGRCNGLDQVYGFRIHYFGNLSNRLVWRHKFSTTPGLLSRARTEVKRFDVVHLHNFRTSENAVLHHYATAAGVPYILSAHGSVLRIIEKQRLKWLYDQLFGYRIFRDAAALIAVSNVEAAEYRAFGEEVVQRVGGGLPEQKIMRVPNGLCLSEFATLPEPGMFRKQHGIASQERLLLFLGRIDKTKGLSFLIEAFSELVQELGDSRLAIAGPDMGERAGLEHLARTLAIGSRVLFTGALNEYGRICALVDADAFVMPSRVEIFGIAAFEALGCGTPVVVTRGTGCGEVIDEAGAGYTVEYGDVRALKEAMIQALLDDETSREMVKRGKEYAKENLAWSKIAARLEDVYSDVLLRMGRSPQHNEPKQRSEFGHHRPQ